MSDSVAHLQCHEDGVERWVLDWHWIVEDDHNPVASVALKRTAIATPPFPAALDG
jgi:hypothetical protein